ncbi:MAG TPA: ATP phosphoribosyltransferase regulatory subunit [Pyrinomonadaceae bacterium]|jgi:ATP phosphoribosyltransferase regulatory subunit|nr:ATP phosphoribosyltransferase regulatory subunit [Pyrinomonadaceae bacterium]
MEPLSKIPAGMRYYFGAEARLRRAVEDACLSVYDGWSYEEIATPTVDYYALFERGMGHDEAHRAFRFTDADGRMLALRPDVTSSVARAAATLFAERPRPLRLCYAASVFRQHPRSHAEWRRESKHLGCELIGAGTHEADIEMLVIAAESLERLGLAGRCRITLNHVEVFNGVAEQLALDGAARERMRQLIDTRDDAELRAFLAACGGATARADALRIPLTRLTGKREILRDARRALDNPRSQNALDALEKLWEVIDALGLADYFETDLGDVSGLDYYTGLVFKIYVEGAGARVGGGGRYDELTANFGRREPAVGFVFDLDAITEVVARLDASHLTTPNRTAAVTLARAETAALFVEAKRRRAQGERIRIRDEGGGMRDE